MAARSMASINKDAAASTRSKTRSPTHHSPKSDSNSSFTELTTALEKNLDYKFGELTKMLLDTLSSQKEEILNHIDARLDLLESRTHILEAKDTDRDDTIARLETHITDLQQSNASLTQDMKSLQSGLNHLEQHNRRWQVRITGLPASSERFESTDTSKHLVCNFFNTSLSLNILKSQLDCAHRVGKPHNNTHTMLVKFHERDIVDLLITNRSKLKGTPFAIFEDSTQINRGLCNRLYKHPKISNSWLQRGNVWAKTTQGQKFKIDIAENIDEVIEKNTN